MGLPSWIQHQGGSLSDLDPLGLWSCFWVRHLAWQRSGLFPLFWGHGTLDGRWTGRGVGKGREGRGGRCGEAGRTPLTTEP